MISESLRLKAEGLACIRGGRLVFKDLNFSLNRGEALMVRGPNGVGKSSLLRQIAGLVEIADGTLTLESGDPEKDLPEQSHYIGHLDALKNALGVRDMLRFWADYFGAGKISPDEALNEWALGTQALLPVAYLSAGQRRRLALARLAFGARPLWLLDEPSIGLDAAGMDLLRRKMEEHLTLGGLIIAATHLDLGLPSAHELMLKKEARP